MRWVIIGSSGYIGSALCRYLVQGGHSVLSISRQSTGPNGCVHRQIKEFEITAFSELFQSGDKVVYCAGLSSVRDCRNRPGQAQALNCQLPVALCSLADEAGVDNFLYLSSVKAKRVSSGKIAGEDAGEPALDPYGASKWRAEQRLLSCSHTTRVNVLRPAAVYGEYGGASDTHAEQYQKRAFVWKKRLKYWGSVVPLVPATGYRSFVALKDLLSAIVLVGEADCTGKVLIVAEPCYYNLRAIGAVASGRNIKSSRLLTRLILFPFKALSRLGVATGLVDVERSELYSAGRLKALLNWQAQERYSRYLRGR